jgi:sugar fermentation stimulation protein A
VIRSIVKKYRNDGGMSIGTAKFGPGGRLEFFRHPEKATFLERPNRFTLLCRRNGKVVKAYLPNPGRMWELLLPGAIVYLERVAPTEGRTKGKMPYTAFAIQKEDHPVMVHTHRTNDLAMDLIGRNLVPGLEGAQILQREIKKERSRFDFLLQRERERIFLEVKSCTLFGRKVAMFPDAVTKRGKKHLEELAGLAQEGASGAVLFLVFWPRAKYFMPEFHTDPEFARALLAAREKISIIPLAVEMRDDLSLTSRTRLLEVPWPIVEGESGDRGSYILILELPEEARLEVGKLGEISFRKGYYLYIGSARKNLSRRIQRHRRMRKKPFWHVDFLRASAKFHHALPIRTQDVLECEIAQAIKGISQWEVPRFGSSDCSCPSHLYGMSQNPFHSPKFISLLQYYRMDRLLP